MKVQQHNITVNVVMAKRVAPDSVPHANRSHRVPRVKVLVSIPSELLVALDVLATAKYSSRSIEVSRALQLLLEHEERAASTSESGGRA